MSKKPEWQDTTSWKRDEDRTTPRTWELNLGAMRIVVTRHIHYPPDMWLLNTYPDVFEEVELKAKEIEAAKVEALQKVQSWNLLLTKQLEAFLGDADG